MKKMMKIKWIDTEKDIPGVGRVNTGDMCSVAEDIGRALIKQGQAKKAKSNTKKRGN
jgi:hypothetical protein